MRRLSTRPQRSDYIAFSGVGRVVRQRRTELGLTQVQVAEMIGTTQDYISKLEIGEYLNPGRETLNRIAKALDMDVRDLERAAQEVNERALNQVEQGWAVSANPVSDLLEIAPYLDKQDLTVLVRMARVLAAGKSIKHNGG